MAKNAEFPAVNKPTEGLSSDDLKKQTSTLKDSLDKSNKLSTHIAEVMQDIRGFTFAMLSMDKKALKRAMAQKGFDLASLRGEKPKEKDDKDKKDKGPSKKADGGGLFGMLKKGALFLAVPAILAFLQSDMWKNLKDWFHDTLLPALKTLWGELEIFWMKIQPHVKKLGEWLKTEGLNLFLIAISASLLALSNLFDDISWALSGEGSWITVLTENKAAIAAISLLLFPKLGFAIVKAAAVGLGTAIKALSSKVLVPMATSLAHALFDAVITAARTLRAGILALNTVVIQPMITSLATAGMAVVTSAMAALRTAILFLNTTIIQPMITSLATAGMTVVTKGAAALRAGLIALNTSVIVEMTKSLAVKGLKYIVTAARALQAAIIAMHAGILAPMLLALGPALVVAAPFIAIAAAVALAVYSLWEAFFDAKAVFDETGDIWAALSEGLASFLATFMGFIPNMVKNIVSWGLKKLGFDAASEWLDSFDIVDSLKGIFRNLFDWVIKTVGKAFDAIVDWFKLLFSDPIGALWELAAGALGLILDFYGWIWDHTVGPFINWIGTLFGLEEGEVTATMWKKLGTWAKAFKDFGTWIYGKTIGPVVEWFKKLFGDEKDGKGMTDADKKIAMASKGKTIEEWVGKGLDVLFNLPMTIYDKYIKPVVNWIKNLFGGDADKPEKMEIKFPDLSAMMPDLPTWENIKSKIGALLNNMLQGLAEMTDTTFIPDGVSKAFANMGVSLATSMGAQVIKKYNTSSEKMEEGWIGREGKFKAFTKKQLEERRVKAENLKKETDWAAKAATLNVGGSPVTVGDSNYINQQGVMVAKKAGDTSSGQTLSYGF